MTGGARFEYAGSGANYLCMPNDPEYSPTLSYSGGGSPDAFIGGTRYEFVAVGTHQGLVPCAVCFVSTS